MGIKTRVNRAGDRFLAEANASERKKLAILITAIIAAAAAIALSFICPPLLAAVVLVFAVPCSILAVMGLYDYMPLRWENFDDKKVKAFFKDMFKNHFRAVVATIAIAGLFFFLGGGGIVMAAALFCVIPCAYFATKKLGELFLPGPVQQVATCVTNAVNSLFGSNVVTDYVADLANSGAKLLDDAVVDSDDLQADENGWDAAIVGVFDLIFGY